MKLLLLHLSDIHIADETDQILQRADAIVRAVKEVEYDVDSVICVVSGDIAFSGKQAQYLLAIEWIDKLLALLRSEIRWSKAPAVQFVAVPGNHDCDFSLATSVREAVRKQVISSIDVTADAQLVEACVEIQKYFFQFLEAIDPSLEIKNAERLCYQKWVKSGNFNIRFICANSAWLSTLPELPASSRFPIELIDQTKNMNTIDVVVIHHPYNWFEPSNARELKKRIEDVADIVLCGHEHEPEALEQFKSTGESNNYIDGGVLWTSENPDISEFHVLALDGEKRKQRLVTFHWDGKRYLPGDVERANTALLHGPWSDLSLNGKHVKGFNPSEKFLDFLEDSGVNLTQRNSSKIKLSNIYVCPSLFERTMLPRGNEKFVQGPHVCELLNKPCHLMITGDDNVGKTALAKYFFNQCLTRNLVPIYLEGSKKLPHLSTLRKHLDELFSRQYDPVKLVEYQQLDRVKRVVIIDDYHKLRATGASKDEILKLLNNIFGKIILVAHDASVTLEDMRHPEIRGGVDEPFEIYGLTKFGTRLRTQLYDKWIAAQMSDATEAGDRAAKLHNLTVLVNTCLGQNYIPSYPPFILAILQAAEATMPVDTRASTHGYYYELFIKTSLARGRNSEINIATNYLSHVAFRMFERRVFKLRDEEFLSLHREYEEKYALTLSFDRIRDYLAECNVIRFSDGEVSFKYKFMYYYFVATYLRDHITSEPVRDEITEITSHLHVEEFANILIFLAHLSMDPFIIEAVIKSASTRYEGIPNATLEDDVNFLNALKQENAQLKITVDSTEDREAAIDEIEKSETNIPEEDDDDRFEITEADPNDPVVCLGGALRTLQIMGQLLKNYPGSLSGKDKQKLATASYDLGRRAIGQILSDFEREQKELVDFYAGYLKTQHPTWSDERIEKRAQRSTYGFGRLILFCLIRRIALSVGAPGLEITYKAILDADPSTAVQLVDASIAVDRVGSFPANKIVDLAAELEPNSIAFDVLRQFVYEHLILFDDTTFRQKEKICKALDINLASALAASPSRKLLRSES